MTEPRTAPELAAMIGGKFGLSTEQQNELCGLSISSLERIARNLAQMTASGAADEDEPGPTQEPDADRATWTEAAG